MEKVAVRNLPTFFYQLKLVTFRNSRVSLGILFWKIDVSQFVFIHVLSELRLICDILIEKIKHIFNVRCGNFLQLLFIDRFNNLSNILFFITISYSIKLVLTHRKLYKENIFF